MASVREYISRVRSENKLIASDVLLSDRAIAAKLKAKASLLIKRETNLRRLWNSPNLFIEVPCIKMKVVPLSECCEFSSKVEITRSQGKMPKIEEGIHGLLVQGVFNVEGSTQFKQTTITRYANTLRLKLKNKDISFWILNDYLYTSSPDLKYVKLIAFFQEDVPNSLMFEEDCPCGTTPTEDPCINPLDKTFKCPAYLDDAVVALVSEDLQRNYMGIQEDQLPDEKDDTSPVGRRR